SPSRPPPPPTPPDIRFSVSGGSRTRRKPPVLLKKAHASHWLNMLIGLPVLAYTVYLLYTGLPIMMGISRDRGFLFSTAVLGVCAYACNRGAGITGYILWHAAFELGWSPGHPVRSTRAQILFL
ncbi:MAG: DUF1282 family protein, partial [Proteobacteria bacterium]|nr:DUF1282 family protein [Pseudomonadota bacterium]